MTMPSRGISDIQRKARGNKMIKAKNKEVTKVAVKKRGINPLDSMSVGAARSLPMGPNAGLREAPMGMKCGGKAMKKGGEAKKPCKGYFKGGSVDGAIKKGHTKGKFV